MSHLRPAVIAPTPVHATLPEASQFAYLPTEPAAVWNAPLVPATAATIAYRAFSDKQLVDQLKQLQQLGTEYPHADMLHKVRSTVDFCKQQLRAYGLLHTAFSFNGGKDCTVLLHLLRLAFAELAEEQANNSYPDAALDSAAVAASLASTLVAPTANTQAEFVKTDDERTSRWSITSLCCIYFQEANEFEEIGSFMRDMSAAYSLPLAHMCDSFKDGLRALQRARPIHAILMGQRVGDPGCTASPVMRSDPGWPVFDRVNPLLQWSYADVWTFLRDFRLPYCTLYEQGYTSLGHKFNTVPNPKLAIGGTVTVSVAHAQHQGVQLAHAPSAPRYRPAWQLQDASSERDGRYSSTAAAANANGRPAFSPIPGAGTVTPAMSPSPDAIARSEAALAAATAKSQL